MIGRPRGASTDWINTVNSPEEALGVAVIKQAIEDYVTYWGKMLVTSRLRDDALQHDDPNRARCLQSAYTRYYRGYREAEDFLLSEDVFLFVDISDKMYLYEQAKLMKDEKAKKYKQKVERKLRLLYD